jgi:hypothetical protein
MKKKPPRWPLLRRVSDAFAQLIRADIHNWQTLALCISMGASGGAFCAARRHPLIQYEYCSEFV